MTALKWPILNTNDFETLVSNIDDINDINDVTHFVNVFVRFKFNIDDINDINDVNHFVNNLVSLPEFSTLRISLPDPMMSSQSNTHTSKRPIDNAMPPLK